MATVISWKVKEREERKWSRDFAITTLFLWFLDYLYMQERRLGKWRASLLHTHTHTHTQSYGTLSQSTLNMNRQWLLLQDLQGVGEKYYYFLYSKKLNRVLMFIAWRQNHTLFKPLLFPGCLPLWTCNLGVGTKSPCQQSIPTCFNTVRKWPCNMEINTKETQHRLTEFLLLFSCSVVSDSLRFHGLQHARLPSP